MAGVFPVIIICPGQHGQGSLSYRVKTQCAGPGRACDGRPSHVRGGMAGGRRAGMLLRSAVLLLCLLVPAAHTKQLAAAGKKTADEVSAIEVRCHD